jgi:hypothetical protein
MIYGFCGKKRSGKTEAAKYLSDRLGGLPIYSFATPVKELCSEMTGLSDIDKENNNEYTGRVIDIKPLKKEIAKWRYDQLTVNEIDHIRALEYYKCNEIWRNIMQYVGTNIFRSRNNQHWCNKFNQAHKNETSFIVDDIRFRNEFFAIIHYADSKIYRIERPNTDDDNHVSETEMDNFKIQPEFVISNTSDNLVKYYNQLDSIFKLG